MNRQRIGSFFLALALLGGVLGGSARATSPSGFTYNVVVTPFVGEPFNDTIYFHPAGALIVDQLGIGVWTAQDFNVAAIFQGVVANPETQVVVTLVGATYLEDSNNLVAVGITSDFSNLFIFQGTAVTPAVQSSKGKPAAAKSGAKSKRPR